MLVLAFLFASAWTALAEFIDGEDVEANQISTATLKPPTEFGVETICLEGIQFLSAETGSTVSGSALSIAGPTGLVFGDVLIAAISWDESDEIVAPTGWTQIRTDVETGNRARQSMFYRVADGTDPTIYGFSSLGGSPEEAVGGIVAYRGVDISNPVDVEDGLVERGPGDEFITAPSVTTTAAGERLVGAFSTTSAGTITSAPEMAERAESIMWNADGHALEIADETIPLPTATGTRVAQQPGVDERGIGQVVALRPAAEPGTSRAEIDWTPTTSAFATSYTLRRKVGGVVQLERTITPATVNSAIDRPLSDNSTYVYELESVYKNWTSTVSVATATTDCS